MPSPPHFVNRRLMRTMLHRHGDVESAILAATGGKDRDAIARAQVALLRSLGLGEGHYLVDVGCGSGRCVELLAGERTLWVLGLDVVPEMVAFAAERCGRSDWRFAAVDGLSIPERDDAADFVSFFSVLTHLSEREALAYLMDAKRVLKPGGKIVASYLDRRNPAHRRAAGGALRQLAHRLMGNGVKNTLVDDEFMVGLGSRLGMPTSIVGTPTGQRVCVYSKPDADVS